MVTKFWIREVTGLFYRSIVIIASLACAGIFLWPGLLPLMAPPVPSRLPILIASANPMTGPSAEFGSSKVKGMQLAITELNEQGGINGQPVELLVTDDAGTEQGGRTLARDLGGNPQVVAVLGHWNSAVMLSSRHIYNGAKLPVLTDAFHSDITDDTTPYVFRAVPSNSDQAEFFVHYLTEVRGFTRGAMIYANNGFGQDMKENFVRHFQQHNGHITDLETYYENQTVDFTLELEKIRQSAPQFLFMAAYSQDAALLIRQARTLGLTVPIIGADSFATAQFIEKGGTDVEGVQVGTLFHPSLPAPAVQTFVRSYNERYHHLPDNHAALAYDCTRMILAAIQQEGASRDGVYRYLHSGAVFDGVTGRLQFDVHHERHQPLVMLEVRQGAFVPVSP